MFDFLPKEKIPLNEIVAIRKKIWDLLSARQLTRTAPKTLHHYTDAAGLKGIVESGVIRGTHLAFMNDASEYLHAVSLLLERVRFERTRANDKLLVSLLEDMESLIGETRPEHIAPYFVACFSAEENSLNQWRAYGRGEGGFSIGFDSLSLFSQANLPNSVLFAAIYDRDEQAELIGDFLLWAMEEYPRVASSEQGGEQERHRKAWTHWMLWLLTAVAPAMKNPAFAEENEWRLIYLATSQERMQFLPRATGLVPFVEINIGVPRTGTPEQVAALGGKLPDQLPITVLWSGPGRATATSLLAGRVLLEKCGYVGVRLEASQIPYRVG
jgi:hypothetical protein